MQSLVDTILTFVGNHFQSINATFYILYALFVLGFTVLNIEYLMIFKTVIHSFICLFLIAKFHPFREHTLSKTDSHIIFSAAMILLINMGVINTIYDYMEKYKIEKRVSNMIELANQTTNNE